jgi:hypothetical protein
VTVSGKASAVSGGNLLDVVLAFDETNSMAAADMQQLRDASTTFINQINPSPGNPNGSRVALAQFQGNKCTDVNNPATCQPDHHVLQTLTDDRNRLFQIVNGPSSGCPALPAQPANTYIPGGYAPTLYGCELKAVGGSGTYVKLGFDVALTPGSWNLFSTANGGRTEAKKFLVVMTDGANSTGGLTQAQANANTVAAAAAVKRGYDNVANSPSPYPDDVEVYVVGFYDQGESNFIGTTPPQCPAAVEPGGASAVDRFMIDSSSSTPGSCDHYFPLSKTTSLPEVFSNIAGNILRGRLSQ